LYVCQQRAEKSVAILLCPVQTHAQNKWLLSICVTRGPGSVGHDSVDAGDLKNIEPLTPKYIREKPPI
jgi:hypothetical protein